MYLALRCLAITLPLCSVSTRGSSGSPRPSAERPPAAVPDGAHDFDFETGVWTTHLSRLQHPLTGSTSWVEYQGTTIVRKVLKGRANLLELNVDGPAGHIGALSLRLYNPQSHQWILTFPNADGRSPSQSTIAAVQHGHGEYFP